jgi:hypothetical protein
MVGLGCAAERLEGLHCFTEIGLCLINSGRRLLNRHGDSIELTVRGLRLRAKSRHGGDQFSVASVGGSEFGEGGCGAFFRLRQLIAPFFQRVAVSFDGRRHIIETFARLVPLARKFNPRLLCAVSSSENKRVRTSPVRVTTTAVSAMPALTTSGHAARAASSDSAMYVAARIPVIPSGPSTTDSAVSSPLIGAEVGAFPSLVARTTSTRPAFVSVA